MMKRYQCVRDCFFANEYHRAGEQYMYPDTVEVPRHLEEIVPPKPAKKSAPKKTNKKEESKAESKADSKE